MRHRECGAQTDLLNAQGQLSGHSLSCTVVIRERRPTRKYRASLSPPLVRPTSRTTSIAGKGRLSLSEASGRWCKGCESLAVSAGREKRRSPNRQHTCEINTRANSKRAQITCIIKTTYLVRFMLQERTRLNPGWAILRTKHARCQLPNRYVMLCTHANR